VASKVKIYEIARALKISSGELLELCKLIGWDHIKHHSQAVEPDEADEIRRKAFLRYRPKEAPAKPKPRPRSAAKAAPPDKTPKAQRPAKPKRRLPSTRGVKPVAPPAPRGRRREMDAEDAGAGPEVAVPPPPPRKLAGRRRQRPPRTTPDEHVTKRTIVFKEPKRRIETKARPTKIEVESPVTVRELSEKMGVPAAQLIKELMFDHDVRASINATIEDEAVQLVGMSHNVEITLREAKTAEELLIESLPEDSPEELQARPPVIALMGHVDHGKTTILDRIRNTDVAEHESGGITQHIAAWQVRVDDHTLTFIDTPGHEAFTAMRARGARVTDIVVLVVAADDGVMPQTIEAISHARAAEVPIVVAINKVDRPDADIERVLRQLAEQDMTPEPWGGDVGCVEVSGLTGQGIHDLLERIILEAELLEVDANPSRRATGAVIEARMEVGRGPLTAVVVENGTLRRGDIIVCGNAFGTVRALYDDRGRALQDAGPARPVEISGLNRVPEAGDMFVVVESLEQARKVAEERHRQIQKRKVRPRHHVTLENLYQSLQLGRSRHLNIVLKADVQGSLAPLLGGLAELGNEDVSVKLVHSAVGQVNTSDILLADAADAVVLAFRVPVDERIREMASAQGIEIREYDVIYHLTEDVKDSLEGLLTPEQHEEVVGRAVVRQTFQISRFGRIAGCLVTEGSVRRNCTVRVVRGGEVIHEGTMASLRQEKNDAREVARGRECGINLTGFNDIQVDDVIECVVTVQVKRTLA